MERANKPNLDPYNLIRFVQAQERDCERALVEIKSGQKQSHWMWYIFPQYDGLGFISTSKWYLIKCVAEAEAYLNHPILGPRLIACAEVALSIEGTLAVEILDCGAGSFRLDAFGDPSSPLGRR